MPASSFPSSKGVFLPYEPPRSQTLIVSFPVPGLRKRSGFVSRSFKCGKRLVARPRVAVIARWRDVDISCAGA